MTIHRISFRQFHLNETLILFNLPVFITVRNKWAEDPFPLRKTHEGDLSIPLVKHDRLTAAMTALHERVSRSAG